MLTAQSIAQVTKKLVLACGLAFAFMLFEIVGGYFAHRCCYNHPADVGLQALAERKPRIPALQQHLEQGI